jgi:hypothetical protein
MSASYMDDTYFPVRIQVTRGYHLNYQIENVEVVKIRAVKDVHQLHKDLEESCQATGRESTNGSWLGQNAIQEVPSG